MSDLDELFARAREKPKKLRIYVRHLAEPAEDWDEEIYGPFPKGGLLLVYTRLPSANLTSSTKQYDKQVMLAFSEERNIILNLPDSMAPLWSWRCSNSAGKPDLCSR